MGGLEGRSRVGVLVAGEVVLESSREDMFSLDSLKTQFHDSSSSLSLHILG